MKFRRKILTVVQNITHAKVSNSLYHVFAGLLYSRI